MKKIFKNISSSILFVIFWWVQALIICLISYLIIGESFMERIFYRPPVFLAPLFLMALYTSYLLVKNNNSKSFLKRIYDKMKKNNLNPKTKNEIKENDVETEMLIENKVSKKRIFSKGWVRLNIVCSFFIPFIVGYLVYILSIVYFPLAFNSLSFSFLYPAHYFAELLLGVFIFHWLLFLFYYLIYKTKKDIISNFWLKIHMLLSTICGLFFFNFKSLQEEYIRSVESNYLNYFAYDIHNYLFIPTITVLAYKIILLLYIWIARGFKDS